MQHKIGSQGLVVPFGYVTTEDKRVYQQGQFIAPGQVVVNVDGGNEADPARTTEVLLRLCGIKDAPKPKGDV